jgi:hypothetical protein
VTLLTNNGPQFTAKFFQAVCAELGVKKVFTTAYHPQTNGQVERYNRTILAALRGYVARRQDDWDEFTAALTYAYNCRVHSSLGMPPLELVLTRPPPTTSLQAQPVEVEVNPAKQKQAFLEKLKSLRKRADGRLSEAQEKYKRTYDRGVPREKNAGIPVGGWAYVRAEVPETGRCHKLYSLVHGPYEVVENDSHTFRLRMGSDVVRISSDRITPAPGNPRTTPREGTTEKKSPWRLREPLSRRHRSPGNGARKTQGKRNERELPRGVSGKTGKRVRWTPEVMDPGLTRSTEEYVIDRLVDEGRDPKGRTIYRVLWISYSKEEDTWDWTEHLPAHFIRLYLRAQGRERRGNLLIAELMEMGLGPWF